MISLKNRIGIVASLLLLIFNFIFLFTDNIQSIINYFGIMPYHYIIIKSVITIFLGLVVAFAFIAMSIKNKNIVDFIASVSFIVYALGYNVLNLLNVFIDIYPINAVMEWCLILVPCVLFIVISFNLFKREGIPRIIGLVGFVYAVIYLLNSIFEVLCFSSNVLILIIYMIFYLFPYIIIISYFAFEEDE